MRRFFFSDLFYVLGKVEFLLEFEDFQDRRFFEFKKENPCFIAESPALKDLVSILGKISASSSPVLISGEHGTGKSAFAFQIFKKRNIDGGKFFSVAGIFRIFLILILLHAMAMCFFLKRFQIFLKRGKNLFWLCFVPCLKEN